MALTNTYKSTARTFDYETPTNKASPMIAYKVTATRSSISSKSVTLKLDFSVGWSNNKKGSSLTDPFKMTVEVGSTTLEVSVNIPKCNGTAGKLYDKNGTTAYSIATETVSETITWTSGNALDITGTCRQAYIGDTQKFSGGSISMPDYSSSSGGGGGGGGSTTIGANSVTSLSVSSITATPNSELIFTIKASKGSNNSISGYKIMLGTNEVGTSNSTSTETSIKIQAPSTEGVYTYTAYVNSSSTGWSTTTKTTNVTIKYITPIITDAYIVPTKVSSSDGGEVRLHAVTNTDRFIYYINDVYQVPDYLYRDIQVKANDIIKVYGYKYSTG